MIEVFLKPLESIVNILVSRYDRKEDRDQKIDADRRLALDTLFIALTTTIAYTETLPDGRGREKELDLSKRWYAAMASCRPYFDDDHVYWMWHKSMYWLKDFDMPEEELTRLKIDLPTVREKVGEMVWWSDVKKHIKPQSDPPQEVNWAQLRLFSAKPKEQDELCRAADKPSMADKSNPSAASVGVYLGVYRSDDFVTCLIIYTYTRI